MNLTFFSTDATRKSYYDFIYIPFSKYLINLIDIVFINNLCIFLCNFYSIKINKTGVNEKTTNEGVIAPFVFTVMSAILCYGLADKIYT